MALVDGRGTEFEVGQSVARAETINRAGSCRVVVSEVTRIENGKIYLDNSPQPLRYPERVLIIGD